MTSLVPSPAEPVLGLEVNKRSPVPVYVQISDALRERIHSGELRSGSILPPSKALCQKLGITRMTLRQAYAVLEREGILTAQRGRGTFVKRPLIKRTLSQMIGFSEEMRAWGKTPSSRLLAFEKQSPDDPALHFLGGGPVYRIERLRLADGVPMAVEEVQIPVSLCPGLERFDFARESLYRVLEHEYRLRFDRCEQIVSASVPDRRMRTLLEISSKVALLHVMRRSYLVPDRPATYGVTRYRADLYTAAVNGDRPQRFGTRS